MLMSNLKHRDDKEIRYDKDGHVFPADLYTIYTMLSAPHVFGVLQLF